jgi:fructose/tagatose bisphosphate aldolase
MERAARLGLAIPGFNIPYLPMLEPVVRALRDCDAFGLVMVARLEWEKFESRSLEAVAENVACTKEVVDLAHATGVPVEAELGAVLGHEAGPLPPYDELFASGKGFTDPDEAAAFVHATGVDWLSVAIGNVHGAIAAATRGKAKVAARLSLARLALLRDAAGIPLVLHGGTGIRKADVLAAVRLSIAKINVATAIRQPYEANLNQGVDAAREAVYRTMLTLLRDELELEHSAEKLGVKS